MAKLEIKGLLTYKGEIEQKNDAFKVREFVVMVVDGDYTDYFKLQLSNDNCAKIDSIQLNQEVEVKLNVKGRRYQKDDKVSYFNSLEAWFVKGIERKQQPTNEIPY